MSTATLKKRKIKIPETMSYRQKLAFQYLVENGGKNKGAALKKAGFSPAIVKNPKRVTQSKAFVRVMEKAGITDEKLATRLEDLMGAARIEHIMFPSLRVEYVVKVDKAGKKLKEPTTETRYRHVPDGIIKQQVEIVPGVKLLYVQKGYDCKRAYISVPENPVRKSGIEMALKVKDHFAPDRLEIVDHELSEEEMAQLSDIFQTQ